MNPSSGFLPAYGERVSSGLSRNAISEGTFSLQMHVQIEAGSSSIQFYNILYRRRSITPYVDNSVEKLCLKGYEPGDSIAAGKQTDVRIKSCQRLFPLSVGIL